MRHLPTALIACAALFSSATAFAQGDPAGVYYGFRADQLNNKVRAEHYTFLHDGRALRGYPTEGLGRPIDWDYECRFAECGTWRRHGAQVVFHNAAAGAETRFTMDASGVLRKSGSTQGYRAMHLLDNARLEGTWGIFDPGSTEPITAIRLTESGRFSETGLLPYLSWADLGADSAQRQGRMPRSGNGAYSIRRGTLELRYDSGLTAYLMVATPPAVPPGRSPATLHVNGTALDRKP
ncbi:MAG: hypothetical protein PHG43_09015 [Phenylobacterium sp.]|nr:hypothetical protein [Phenylobacterium sp.]